jgi:hypothetical protein
MTYSLLALKPNQDFQLNQVKTQFACQGLKIQLEIDPNEGLLLQINDGNKIAITQDMPMSIEGVRFTIKVDDGSFALFPQSDGIEIIGNVNDPDVYKVMQNNLRSCLNTITKVSELEQNEKQLGASKVEGNQSSASNQGYALLCQLYLLFHQNGLDKKEKSELNNAYQALISLAKLAQSTEDMTSELLTAALSGKAPDESLYANYDETKNYSYTPKLKNIVRSLGHKLIKEGTVFINYGLGGSFFHDKETEAGHHEDIRISFEGNPDSGVGKYRCTVYNAGYESDWVDSSQGLVKGIKEYELTCSNRAEVERFMKLAIERVMRGEKGISKPAFDTINTEFKKYIAREIRSNQKLAQTRGNCTTMSTRLFLEEMLSPTLFRNLYRFVSNPANLNQLLLSVPAPEEKQSQPQTTGKVTDKIQKLASTLAASKAFGSPNKSNMIQELINKNDSSGLITILETEATKLSSVSYLQTPMDMKVNYDIGGGKKGTLLHFAIKNQNPKLAGLCLALGMTGVEKDAAGYPALHMAILHGQNDIARMIIDKNKKSKNHAALSTPSNDGVTAIKLALECNRVDVIRDLVDASTDLSPEKNDGHVIFNMLIEKALFDAESLNYFPILNLIIKNPAQNNIDPNIVNGLGKSSIQIFQGKIMEEAKYGKPLDPNLVELLNNLCRLDIHDHAKMLMNDQQLMTLVFPHLTMDVFKDVFKAFVDGYNASQDKSTHYLGLIMPALQSDNTEKLDFILKQKIRGMGTEILVYLFTLLDIAPAGVSPISLNAIQLVLQHVTISQKSADELRNTLKKFYTEAEITDIMKLATIKISSYIPANQESKEENDPVIEIPPDNHEEIKNELMQLAKQNEVYRRDITEQFVERKKAYYKFGDLSRAIIQFLTGFDVTRKEGKFQPTTSIPEEMRKFWASMTGNKFSSPGKSGDSAAGSSHTAAKPGNKK